MDAWLDLDAVIANPASFDALLVADGDTQAEETVALAGGRIARRWQWSKVAREDGAGERHAIMLLDLEGADAVLVERALPVLAERAIAQGCPVVATFDEAQIDLAAAHLFGTDMHLLCSASVAERVAAVTIAAGQASRVALHDRVSEGEAARLRKLNEEVARIAEVLARLSRREDVGLVRGDVADRRIGFDPGPAATAAPTDVAHIRNAIRARRLRDRFFSGGLFEDPGWDMLLDLYAAHLDRGEVSVSSLCIAAAVAPTTALRWITKMTDAGLFVREPDPFDRRRAFMRLSDEGLRGMAAYVAACRAQGLPIV